MKQSTFLGKYSLNLSRDLITQSEMSCWKRRTGSVETNWRHSDQTSRTLKLFNKCIVGSRRPQSLTGFWLMHIIIPGSDTNRKSIFDSASSLCRLCCMCACQPCCQIKVWLQPLLPLLCGTSLINASPNSLHSMLRHAWLPNLSACSCCEPQSNEVSLNQLLTVSPTLLLSLFFLHLSRLFLDFNLCPQRQRLIRARVSPEEGAASGEEGSGANRLCGRENGSLAQGDKQMVDGETERSKESFEGASGGAPSKEEEEDEEEQEEGEGESTPFKPFILPGELE